MAQAGRSKIRSEIQYKHPPLPEDIAFKRFNFMWRADDMGKNIIEVGFKGQTGKQTTRRGKVSNNYAPVEEWYDVADPVYDKRTNELVGYQNGTAERANAVVEESVWPRIQELFADSEDVYPTGPQEEDELGDDVLAPSVDPLPASGNIVPTIRGKKGKG